VLNIRLLDGRALTDSDRAGAEQVVVINESLASRLGVVGPALGQTVGFDFVDPPYMAKVVGVVADIRHERLGVSPMPEAYFPSEQTPQPTYSMAMRSERDAADVTRMIRTTLNTIDPGLSFSTVTSMTDYVERSLASPRMQAQLIAAFAVVALIVAVTGLYSLLAFLADGSRREWAVRLALGASPGQIQVGLLALALRYSVLATAIGLAVVLAAGATLKAVLYGVDVWDPTIVGVSALFMIATCVLAAVGPAMRVREIGASEVLRA
jgi:ABC-type antimicrobial peptide transport system permease subunit